MIGWNYITSDMEGQTKNHEDFLKLMKEYKEKEKLENENKIMKEGIKHFLERFDWNTCTYAPGIEKEMYRDIKDIMKELKKLEKAQ